VADRRTDTDSIKFDRRRLDTIKSATVMGSVVVGLIVAGYGVWSTIERSASKEDLSIVAQQTRDASARIDQMERSLSKFEGRMEAQQTSLVRISTLQARMDAQQEFQGDQLKRIEAGVQKLAQGK